MTARLVAATRNPGKVREIAALLGGLPGLTLVGLDAFPAAPAVEESGDTYRDNALVKARAAAAACGLPALADDSGLEVDALGGGPGPRSARFGGPGLDDAGRVAVLLDALRGIPDARRTARFRCVVALVIPGDPEPLVAEGTCEGRILDAPRGAGGFGYDPVFLSTDLRRTFAEAAPADKRAVSHRARAVAALLPGLRDRLGV